MTFSQDNRYLATSNGTVGIWELKSGELLRRVGGAGNISDNPFSPKGDLFVTSDLKAIFVWSFPGFDLLCRYKHGSLSPYVVFASDSKHLIIDGSQVWRFPEGSRLRSDKEQAFLEAEKSATLVVTPLPEVTVDPRN